jgi:hypothetical protein
MADLPDTEPSAVGRNAEFNEFVKKNELVSVSQSVELP